MSFVAQNIKYLREKDGFTQKEFGLSFGWSRYNVSSYEDGRAMPPLKKLIAIAEKYGIGVIDMEEVDLSKRVEVNKEEAELTMAHSGEQEREEAELAIAHSDEQEGKGADYQDNVTRNFPTSLFDIEVKVEQAKPQKSFNSTTISRNEPKAKPKFNQAPQHIAPPANHLNIEEVSMVGEAVEYGKGYNDSSFLAQLPTMSIPLYQKGSYRAFEARHDSPSENAWYVCSFVNNWFELKPEGQYFILTKDGKLLHRKVYNEVKSKGELLLSGLKNEVASSQLAINHVQELWEVVSYLNYGAPDTQPTYNKLNDLVEELRFELFRLSK